RKKIYRLLTQFAENNWQREAYVFPIESFDNYFKDSDVAPETVELVRKLSYPYGKLLLFADLPYVLDTLPAFEQKQHLEKAGSRLYSYPFPSFNQPENCHWTSFNFFRDPPDNRYSDLKFLREKLDADYYPMFSDPRYGDLVFLTKPNGDIVHSAVFLADDVV